MIDYIPKFFELSEFIHSDTAINRKFKNIPDWNGINRLNILAQYLDVYREELGEPIFITSGFRCPLLNVIVGGSATSHHCKCEAVDLQIGNRTENDAIRLFNFLKSFNEEHDINIDQCFIEYKKSTNSYWVHLGFNFDNPNKQRNQYGSINV